MPDDEDDYNSAVVQGIYIGSTVTRPGKSSSEDDNGKADVELPIGYGYYYVTTKSSANYDMKQRPLLHPMLYQGCWNPEKSTNNVSFQGQLLHCQGCNPLNPDA